MKKSNIEIQLQDIIDNEPRTLKAYVAEEAIGYDEIEEFFMDLQQHGCICGMVSSLIYYTDTHQFFEDYYLEIEDLRQEVEEQFGEPLQIKGDLKNTLAWFAFEQTAHQLYIELFCT